LDRLWHGTPRLKALAQLTHIAVRLKSDIPLKRTSETYPDHTYLAEISGDGVTMTVRVIEYFADIEGQQVEEMFCLVTDLLDWREYPGPGLAGLYKWRWDGSETALREAKAPLHGAGPGTGAMLRSGSPELIAQEIAAWAVSTEMTRGVTRDAALAAAPAKKGRRAGLPVRYRDLSLARAAASSSPRSAPGTPATRRWPAASPDIGPSPTGTGTGHASPSPPARVVAVERQHGGDPGRDRRLRRARGSARTAGPPAGTQGIPRPGRPEGDRPPSMRLEVSALEALGDDAAVVRGPGACGRAGYQDASPVNIAITPKPEAP
jgi:hypothetical protein